MLNKKRLAMMAVAASMVLPNNLVYLATNTPILATDAESTTPEPEAPQTVEPKTISTATDFSNLEGSYKLSDDLGEEGLVLDSSIKIEGKVVLDLNGKTISSSITSGSIFLVGANASLEIVGPGTIISTATSANVINVLCASGANSQLTVGPGVELKSKEANPFVYGITVGKDATSAIVNVTGATITTTGGVTVNGLASASESPIINLTQVTINATTTNTTSEGYDSIGIYQAGPSTINVVNCTVTSDKCGIETRAGTLNVSGGTITGGQGTEISHANGNGSTALNTGIAIAQHSRSIEPKYPSISANITKATVSGGAAIAITDPQGNLDKESTKFNEKGLYKDISLVVSESTLTGKVHDVAYTTSKIGFALINTEEKNKATTIKKCKIEDAKTGILSEDTDSTDQKVPYTLINKDSSTPTEASTSIKVNTLPDGVILTDNKLASNDLETVATALATDLAKQQKAVFTPITNVTGEKAEQPVAVGYTYKVTVNPEVVELPDGNYSLQIKLEAVLDENSGTNIVRLFIPCSDTESAMIMSETGDTTTDGSFDTSIFALDVQLNAVADMSTGKFIPDNIKQILSTIPEATNFIPTEVDKFANVTFTGNHTVVDTETPVVFTVGDAVEPKPVKPGNTSSKPKPKPEEPAVVEATPTPIYRLYNRLNGEHLYTLDKNEKDNLLTSDTWKDEGQAWIAPSESNYPVYRLLNPNNGDHHYTMDKNEFDTLPSYGWTAEGVAFFSGDVNNSENVILHRLYNPNETGAGSHLYTVDTNERDTLEGLGWKYEGTAWAALPETK
ncbi:MAG: hypothetical protein K2H85_11905 [Allobaculum sp.]|nr:hypothetical protein [Allobaculum sp.]